MSNDLSALDKGAPGRFRATPHFRLATGGLVRAKLRLRGFDDPLNSRRTDHCFYIVGTVDLKKEQTAEESLAREMGRSAVTHNGHGHEHSFPQLVSA